MSWWNGFLKPAQIEASVPLSEAEQAAYEKKAANKRLLKKIAAALRKAAQERSDLSDGAFCVCLSK